MLKVNFAGHNIHMQGAQRLPWSSGLGLGSVKGSKETGWWLGRKRVLSPKQQRASLKGHWAGRRMEHTTTTTTRRRTVITMVKGGELEGNNAEEVARLVPDGGDGEAVDPDEIRRMYNFNQEFNKLTKWLATSMAVAAVLWKHDEHALWFSLGAVANGGLCKVLKYIINEERPATADGVKADPGMPSSHAQGFAYLGTYAALALFLWLGPNLLMVSGALWIILVFAYSSWLRISEGLHTAPQVLVGNTIGSITALFWLWLWKASVESLVESSTTYKYSLYGTFALAVVLGYFLSLKDWRFGEP